MVENEKSKEQLIQELADAQRKLSSLEGNFAEFKTSINENLSRTKEEARLSKRSNNILLSNMSHDIRVPMNGIMGMIEVLQQTDLSDEQFEYLEIVNNSANNLLNIIDNILDFSKLETGDIRLQENDFQLNREIDSIYSLQSMRAHGKGVGLGCTISPELPQNLIGDSARMKQILNNLVANAIKFTKEGEVLVEVTKEWEKANKIMMKFSVKDTGIGINEETESLIRKSFANLENLSAFNHGVIGIGLSIANSLANLLGGEVGFTTQENKGSEFWFTALFERATLIPEDMDLNQMNKIQHAMQTLGSNSEILKVLLVEDNVLNQKFATATLKKRGHIVEIAENGKVALSKIKDNIYDLVLMDVQMPVMDGVEATLEIRDREKRENIKHLKIIAVTAYALDRDREKCLSAGMDKFLAKPFKPDDLIQMVENLDL